MKKILIALLLAGGVAALGVASATLVTGDEGKMSFKADLNGYNEVVGSAASGDSGSVSTGARGMFRAKLRGNPPTELEFELTYSGIEGGTVTAAHPHFAQRQVGGGIFGFLCGGPKPACPTPGGTVEGVWTAADITGPVGQGVEPGSFDEFVRALRAGAVYVNVHSSGAPTSFPEGEIRGQIEGDD